MYVGHRFLCITLSSCLIQLYIGVLSVSQLCNDCFVCSDDMEGSDGCHQQREPNCCGSEVFAGLPLIICIIAELTHLYLDILSQFLFNWSVVRTDNI